MNDQSHHKISASNLSHKMWWRFAQAIFVLVAVILVLVICIGTGVAIKETDTLVKNKSVFTCDGGQSYLLDAITEKLKMYSIESSDINDRRFSEFRNDAKAKIFCTVLNINLAENRPPGLLLPSDLDNTASDEEAQEEFAISMVDLGVQEKYDDLESISQREITRNGEDMGYTVDAVYDYKIMWSIIGIGVSALLALGIILFIIRGIARYTLIGKFL